MMNEITGRARQPSTWLGAGVALYFGLSAFGVDTAEAQGWLVEQLDGVKDWLLTAAVRRYW